MTHSADEIAIKRCFVVSLVACAVVTLSIASLFYLWAKRESDSEDWIRRSFEGDNLTVLLSMRGPDGLLLSSQLPAAVVDDLKSLTLGTQPTLDSGGLQTSLPYGIIDIISDSDCGRLEWHLEMIVDSRSSPSRIWTGRAPTVITHKVYEHDGVVTRQTLESIVSAWESSVRSLK